MVESGSGLICCYHFHGHSTKEIKLTTVELREYVQMHLKSLTLQAYQSAVCTQRELHPPFRTCQWDANNSEQFATISTFGRISRFHVISSSNIILQSQI